jgi:hypothetical protein
MEFFRRYGVEIVAGALGALAVASLLILLPFPRVRPPAPVDAALEFSTEYSLDSVSIGGAPIALRWHPQPRIDPPRGAAIVFSGWAADDAERAPITKIVATVDGDATFPAIAGLQRADVAVALGNPVYAASGFRLTIPACSLAPGEHTIAFRFEAADGRGYYRSRDDVEIYVNGGPPATRALYAVDAIVPPPARPGAHEMSGWLVDAGACAPARGVEVRLDGRIVATARYGVPRPDVARTYGNPAYARSGFRAVWSDAGLARGSHTLRLQARLAGSGPSGEARVDPGYALQFAR